MKARFEFGKTEVGTCSHTDFVLNVEAATESELQQAAAACFAEANRQTAPETWLAEYGHVRWIEEVRRATPDGCSWRVYACLFAARLEDFAPLREAWSSHRTLGPFRSFVIDHIEAPRFLEDSVEVILTLKEAPLR